MVNNTLCISKTIYFNIVDYFCFLSDIVNYITCIVLNKTSDDSSEIFVMGVKKEFHRLGVGRELIKNYENLSKEFSFSYSQVKTVKSGCYKEYDITNKFYISMGYVELECFPDMWNEWNPCQIYIKYLK